MTATPKKRESQATIVVNAVRADPAVELFHTSDGDEYSSIMVNSHRETYPIRSGAFRSYLRRVFFRLMQKAPGASAINDTVNMCRAIASDVSSPTHPVFLRTGETDSGTLWLDVADPAWMAVRIQKSGWDIVANPPVRFRRAPGAMAISLPESGGRLDLLRQFVNLESDADWCLLLSWLGAALRPRGPFPILGLHGEQGSSKSTLSRMIRALIDPYKAPLRSLPSDERDLQIAAANSFIVAIDNVSGIPRWLSDALCRLSTGGGLSTRTLYTDTEETIFDAMRPVLLNGIDDVATRGDFAERSIVLYLPQIPANKRQEERLLWASFKSAEPKILGALLSAVAEGLGIQEAGVALKSSPRMCDFATWAVALERPFGFPAGTFLGAYEQNRADATSMVLEDPVPQSLIKFAADRNSWTGTASELLGELTQGLPLSDKAFPKNAIAFANLLRRLAPTLRTVGVIVRTQQKRQPKTGRRLVEISFCGPQ